MDIPEEGQTLVMTSNLYLVPLGGRGFAGKSEGQQSTTCTECEKTFARPYTLRRHMRNVHGIEVNSESRDMHGAGRKVAVNEPYKIRDYVSNLARYTARRPI